MTKLNSIKILQVNSVANTGSTGRIAGEIGQLAIDNGWESHIAYGRKARPSKSELIRIGCKLDVNLHVFQTRIFDRHGFGSKRATRNFVANIKKINPDIIHLHNIHGYYLNVEVLFNYLKQAGKPIVWTLHDCWAFTGHCSHFDGANCLKWQTKCFDCPSKKKYPKSWFFDNSKNNYSRKKELFTGVDNLAIVTPSNWLATQVKNSFLQEYSLKVINNGVDLNVFRPENNRDQLENHPLINKPYVIGVASVWTHSKGLYDFIKLRKLLPPELQIVLVGLNKKQIQELPPEIIGIKRTENVSELAELYREAELTLNLSAEESFGLTTVEGFASGTPGIVYNSTASPELITPDTGFVVEKGSFQELVNAINTIKANGKKHYVLACRNRAEKLYNKDDRYSDYIKLYKAVM